MTFSNQNLIAGDENKQALLAIDSILEKLLDLLHNDEPFVRRNVCMAFASLCRHGMFALQLEYG